MMTQRYLLPEFERFNAKIIPAIIDELVIPDNIDIFAVTHPNKAASMQYNKIDVIILPSFQKGDVKKDEEDNFDGKIVIMNIHTREIKTIQIN